MPYLFTRGLPRTATASLLFLLTACAEAPAQPISPIDHPPALLAATPEQLSFSAWRDQLRTDALGAGITAEIFDRAFAGLVPNPDVIRLDSSQPEFTRPVWEYLNDALSTSRVTRGRILLAQQRTLYTQIEQRYGVDAETLVAIWGMESNFGSNTGSYNVVRALATLAYEGRRQAFWREQLLDVLRIFQYGDVAPENLLGSWAGAMGQTQFMPSTYNQHAVDFDGDGKRDIWTSSSDALASAAHYLQSSNWQLHQPWGFEVSLPHNFDYALAAPETRRSLNEWRALGVQPLRHATGVPPGDSSASLLLPAGHRGPAFLVLGNFRSILRYNNSSAYALAIGLLSDALRGGVGVQGHWPEDDRPLSRHERIELQQRLSARGYDAGQADGIIGTNTRKAIRGFQLHLGWPADGYPDSALLEQLRQRP
jgi:membrane-bound lytic murein transglycosylase B